MVRFKNPEEGATVVEDVVHGAVTFQNKELDDLIIARSDGTPTYNFCVVVDDADMGVTHVIRGDDHLNNTPRQMNMLLALDKPVPVYAHVPMILGPDGAKLSKRHGAVSVLQYQEEGYLPEALLNYLVRLGWSHGDQEFFTMAEMIAAFDVRDINKSASAMNLEKLLWINQQHMVRADPKHVVPHLQWQLQRLGIESDDQALLEGIIVAQRERAKTLKEMAANSRFFFGDAVTLDAKAAEKHLTAGGASAAGRIRAHGSPRCSDWAAPAIHAALEALRGGKRTGAGQDRAAAARRGLGRHGVAAHRCDPGAAGPRARARRARAPLRLIDLIGLFADVRLLALDALLELTAYTAKYQVPGARLLTV